MAIKWSALELAEAMDEVEKLINQADPYLAEAESRVRKATGIHNLPKYMHERLMRLVFTIQRARETKISITSVRKGIPKGAVEAEQATGRQQNLGLETESCTIRKRDDFWEYLEQKMKK